MGVQYQQFIVYVKIKHHNRNISGYHIKILQMNQLFFTPDQQSVFQESIETYGKECQLDQVQEEAIELALAIRKYKRAKLAVAYTTEGEFETRTKELISEIADVIIMTQQCRLIFDDKVIQSEIDRKLTRQRKRLDDLSIKKRMKFTTSPFLSNPSRFV